MRACAALMRDPNTPVSLDRPHPELVEGRGRLAFRLAGALIPGPSAGSVA